MKQLIVLTTDGENKTFQGKDAQIVYQELINSRGADITPPIQLENGWTVHFILKNIISFSIK